MTEWGTPIQDWIGYHHHPGHDGVPLIQDRIGYPHPGQNRVPPGQGCMGYPCPWKDGVPTLPFSGWTGYAWTGYGMGGMRNRNTMSKNDLFRYPWVYCWEYSVLMSQQSTTLKQMTVWLWVWLRIVGTISDLLTKMRMESFPAETLLSHLNPKKIVQKHLLLQTKGWNSIYKFKIMLMRVVGCLVPTCSSTKKFSHSFFHNSSQISITRSS